MPVTLLSLWFAGKYRDSELLNRHRDPLACAKLAGLKQIITSHNFLEH